MKLNLPADKNRALQGLNLQEKLDKLHLWKKQGEITQETFNYLSNRWINKESRRVMGLTSPLSKSGNENTERGLSCTKSIVEGEMQNFLDLLRKRLNTYLSKRCKESVKLTDAELDQLKKYLTEFSYYRSKVNRLLVVGLRFPDKRANELCYNYIAKRRKYAHSQDFTFWGLLWEDGNLVPLDAVRLMLVPKDNKYSIDPCFDPRLIQNLLPAIRYQRDKEIQRLKWAQSLEGNEREREVARKTRRLEAFNMLLEAAEIYTSGM